MTGIVIGPYEHVAGTREVVVLRGRIELHDGEGTIVADVFGGAATLELVEEFDDVVHVFGLAEPIRYLKPRRRLRLTVDCDLDRIVIARPRDGEAVADESATASEPTPDATHRPRQP